MNTLSQRKQSKKQPEKKEKFKKSETVIIKRSQINFMPGNPKRHTQEAVQKQLRNFKNVGFLGGIVWNETTSNLISGHKRLMAMDQIIGYDGTPAKDYNVKIEKVSLTRKQEIEQNIFMDAQATNTPQDLDMLANLIPEIDFKLAGLEDNDLKLLNIEVPLFTSENTSIKNDFQKLGSDYEQRKKKMQQIKKELKRGLMASQGATYVTLSFDKYENKAQFLETYGFNPDSIMIKGEEFFEKMNE